MTQGAQALLLHWQVVTLGGDVIDPTHIIENTSYPFKSINYCFQGVHGRKTINYRKILEMNGQGQ